ncbi:MAG: hypothetical protein ACPGVK_09490 [Halocynthiibacter sp.]
MKLMVFTKAACVALIPFLSACDVVMTADINEDATITTHQVQYFDEEACDLIEGAAPKPICRPSKASDKEKIVYNAGTNTYEITPPGSPRTQSLEKFAKGLAKEKLASASWDEAARELHFEMDVAALSSVARRGPSNKTPKPSTEFKYGPLALHEDHNFIMTFNAKEITRTTGTISSDGTSTTFTIPMSYFVYGIGDAGYDEISFTAKY